MEVVIHLPDDIAWQLQEKWDDGVPRHEHELLVEDVKEVVCGGGIVFGNIESDLIEILARLLRETIAAHEGG